MWKLQALVLILAAFGQSGSLLAARVPPSRGGLSLFEREFKDGGEYVYSYEGQLLTGLPHRLREFAGMKMRANVRLQVQRDDHVFAQLEDISIHRFHDEVEHPKEQVPIESMMPISGPEVDDFITWLKQPVTFVYRSGKIVEVDSVPDEPASTVNLKKAVLNMFQVTLQKENDSGQEGKWNHTLYNATEIGITGECDVLYEASQWKDDEGDSKNDSPRWLGDVRRSWYNKTKNLQGCRHVCELDPWAVPYDPDEEHDNLPERDPVMKATVVASYVIRGTPAAFLIESATSDAQYMMAPMLVEQGPVTMTKQNLTLLSAGSWLAEQDDRLIRLPDVVQVRHGALQLEAPPTTALWGMPKWVDHYDEGQRHGVDSAKTGRITEILNDIADGIGEDLVAEAAPEKFMILVKELRTLNEEEWRWAFDTWVEKPSGDAAVDKRRNILVDAVPFVGTEEVLRVAFEKMESGKLNGETANRVLTSLALVAPSEEELVTRLLDLCKTDAIKDQEVVRSTCWLSLGALVNKVCVQRNKCSNKTKENVVKNLVAGIDARQPAKQQMMCLKAMGNAGLPETFQELTDVAGNDKYAEGARSQAMYSLFKFTRSKMSSEKVRAALFPVYADATLDQEIRIAALVTLMNTDVSLTFYELLAQRTHTEQNSHVGAFIYSTLWSMSRLRHPLFRKQAEYATLALRIAKPWPFSGIHMSKTLATDLRTVNDKLGVMASFAMIGHPSLVPRGVAARLDVIIMDQLKSVVEVGYRQEGILPFLAKVLPIGPKPITTPKKSGKSFETVDGVEGIANSLKMKAKKPEKPSLSIYLKLLGNELLDLPIDGAFVAKLLSQLGGADKLRDDLRERKKWSVQKAMMLGENVRMAVTEIGVPVMLNATMSAVVSTELEGDLKFGPDMFADESLQKARTVEASLKTTPVMAIHMNSIMGADATILKTGIAMEATLQTATSVTSKMAVDVSERKLQHFVTLPGKEMKLLNLKVKPHTFSMVGKAVDDNASKIMKVVETGATKHEISRAMDLKPINDLLDRDVEVSVKCTQMETGPLPWMCDPVSGAIDMAVTLKPRHAADLEIESDMRFESVPRASLVGQDWRQHEDQCVSRERTCQVISMAVGKKDTPKEKWAEALVHLDMEDDRYNSVESELSLLPYSESQKWKVCLHGETVSPNRMVEDGTMEPQGKEKKVWIGLGAGATCQDNRVKAEVTMTKTDEQLKDELEKRSVEDDLCENDRRGGKPYSETCRNLTLMRSRLNKVLVEVTGDKVLEKELVEAYPRIMANVRHYLWDFRSPALVDYLGHYLKRLVWGEQDDVWWWWWMDGSAVPEKDKLSLLLEVDRALNGLNATVKTPSTWDVFNISGLPIKLPTPSTKESLVDQIVKKALMHEITPSCKITGSDVNTFDNATFRHEFGECDHLVAMDGTADEMFAVTAAKKPGTEHKIVTVVLENKKIDLLPANSHGEGFVVKMDGQNKPLMRNERMLVRLDNEVEITPIEACGSRPERVDDKWSPVLFEIRHHSGHLELVADQLGLRVKTDGKNFKVQVSQLMRSKLVGMCGNFDGESFNDNIAAHGLVTPRWHKFAETWQMTSEWCRNNRIPF